MRARATQRKSTSDFMKMERERGISISSTCLTFEYDDVRINLMDTPGHADFSEDTYRTLSAADNVSSRAPSVGPRLRSDLERRR